MRVHPRVLGISAGLLLVLGAAAPAPPAGGGAGAWYPRTDVAGAPAVAVFESKLPCADCERMKIGLVLYRRPGAARPTSYFLGRIHVGKGDVRTTSAGAVTTSRGAGSDPEALVYELDSNAPRDLRSLWVLSEDVLFVLDGLRQPRVGNPSNSYALNRTR